jgi:hypothetical protein
MRYRIARIRRSVVLFMHYFRRGGLTLVMAKLRKPKEPDDF